jgi:8-oxo-dGTP pyrophosphatase MutT (NUDIX family)
VLHPLSPDFAFVERPGPPPLPHDLEQAVEALWSREVEESGGERFNGVLFSLVDHGPERVTAERSEYRRYVAWRRSAELAERLNLRPMGVTALTRASDGAVVMGRRARGLDLGGLWETAPAGTLDRPDPRALVLDELREEIGVTADQVASAEARWVYEDRTGVSDIVYEVRLTLSTDELSALFESRPTDEYSDLALVPWVAFRASGRREDFTPLARAIAAAQGAS